MKGCAPKTALHLVRLRPLDLAPCVLLPQTFAMASTTDHTWPIYMTHTYLYIYMYIYSSCMWAPYKVRAPLRGWQLKVPLPQTSPGSPSEGRERERVKKNKNYSPSPLRGRERGGKKNNSSWGGECGDGQKTLLPPGAAGERVRGQRPPAPVDPLP